MEKAKAGDSCGATVARAGGFKEDARAFGMYHVVCHGPDGKEKWRDTAINKITDVGLALMEDTILAGSTFTATTYMGLKGTGSAAAGDTQASHAGWLEVGNANDPDYTAPRKTISWAAASGTGTVTKASTGTYTFAMLNSGTVAGCFININGSATIDNTTGTLFSAGDFTGGSKTVGNGDSLTVTYTLSITAS
jgi:hypothetical protein